MKIPFTLLIFIFIIFILIPSVSAIVINEVMQCGNETKEWVEIYNPSMQLLNLSEWQIRDNYETDNIICGSSNCSIVPNSSFFIILGNSTNISSITNTSIIFFYVDDKKIGNGLAKNDSLIFFSENYNYSTNMSYNTESNCPANSISRNPDGADNWTFCIPTPGQKNNCTQQQQQEKEIDLDYPSEVECNEEFYIEIEASGFEDGDYDVKIDILEEDSEDRIGKVWNDDEEKWQSTNKYIIKALEIENGEGDVKLKFKIEDFEGDAILRPKIRETGSSSYEQFDDEDIKVKCDIQEESEINIIEFPEKAKFGEKIRIEIEVYRGDTAKYSIYVYVQDNEGIKVSDKISLHFDEKFQTQTETVEITLKCKNEEGIYEIIAEGLDTSDMEKIKLEPCESTEETETTTTSIKSENEEQKYSSRTYSYPGYAESESFLINRTMPYILSSIALLLVIYLIIKKI
ncbi:MAG: lamin tail domain-containing protein [Candidatus Pacearchaeota archaeon]|nr:MAG: lamin tail domain-containing protein [Candidatus Pacearchaeota archaeon]